MNIPPNTDNVCLQGEVCAAVQRLLEQANARKFLVTIVQDLRTRDMPLASAPMAPLAISPVAPNLHEEAGTRGSTPWVTSTQGENRVFDAACAEAQEREFAAHWGDLHDVRMLRVRISAHRGRPVQSIVR